MEAGEVTKLLQHDTTHSNDDLPSYAQSTNLISTTSTIHPMNNESPDLYSEGETLSKFIYEGRLTTTKPTFVALPYFTSHSTFHECSRGTPCQPQASLHKHLMKPVVIISYSIRLERNITLLSTSTTCWNTTTESTQKKSIYSNSKHPTTFQVGIHSSSYMSTRTNIPKTPMGETEQDSFFGSKEKFHQQLHDIFQTILRLTGPDHFDQLRQWMEYKQYYAIDGFYESSYNEPENFDNKGPATECKWKGKTNHLSPIVAQKLKCFIKWMTHEERPYELHDDFLATLTRDSYLKFRYLDTQSFSSSPSSHHEPSKLKTSFQGEFKHPATSESQTALNNFKKGTKRDASVYPIFKNDKYYDTFQRAFLANLKAQGLYDVAGDARSIILKLRHYHTKSNVAQHDIITLTTDITNLTLNDSWKGTVRQFLSHFKEKLRLLDSLVPVSDQLPEITRIKFLQIAVQQNHDLRQIHVMDSVWRFKTDLH